jgi:hypothetical protein
MESRTSSCLEALHERVWEILSEGISIHSGARFRCNGGRAERSNFAHPAKGILGECSLPSYLQRTVTTRPAESE